MKPPILLLAFFTAAAFSSCTTAYKTGQTPDDVYFSPARPQDEYVKVEKKDDTRYQSSDEYYDDRYLRMKVHNRTRWSELDDWYYQGARYDYTYYPNSLYNPWTPYSYWNCRYNPYYHTGVIISTKSPTYYGPRVVNLNPYNNSSLTTHNYTHANVRSTSGGPRNSTYTPSTQSSSSNIGSILRNVFNGNNSSGSSSTPSHNGTSSTSSSTSGSGSGSSSSSSGSSAPVRRF